MPSSILTSKGQITIPAEVREAMGLKKGDRVEFIKSLTTDHYEMVRRTGSFADLICMFQYEGPPVTVEQMNEAIGQHLAEDDARIVREWNQLYGKKQA